MDSLYIFRMTIVVLILSCIFYAYTCYNSFDPVCTSEYNLDDPRFDCK